MLEVQPGKMAAQKGVSNDIKQPGTMMVKDHTVTNTELKATTKERNITLPDVLSDKCRN